MIGQNLFRRWIILAGISVVALTPGVAARGNQTGHPRVTVLRTPQGGIQPQVAVDARGVLHLLYFKGDPSCGDIYYARKAPGAAEFSDPIRVNSQSGCAIAMGSVRGPQLALGRNGRVHVAWMAAHPEGPERAAPMLYTRLNDTKSAFEPERNVMQFATGLDGGASVAADKFGNVYVVWHANPQHNGEAHRRVWVAWSSDEGKTFAREIPADPFIEQEPTGACGCCGMRALTDEGGTLYIFYRAATNEIHRDTVLLVSRDYGRHFVAEWVAKWELNACPMSTDFISRTRLNTLIAWETAGQVFYARVAPGGDKISEAVAPPGPGGDRKHPVVVSNARGEILLAWTDGTAWQRGGSVAWQVFDEGGRPLSQKGNLPGLPVWDLVAAFAGTDGRFTILY